jgi:hypothetical protein
MPVSANSNTSKVRILIGRFAANQGPTPSYAQPTPSRNYNHNYYGNGMNAPQEIVLSEQPPHPTHRMLTPLILPSHNEPGPDSAYSMQASFSGDSDDNSGSTPTSPISSRRHPVHPEGMPQPKGRGARKPTKVLHLVIVHPQSADFFVRSSPMMHPKHSPVMVVIRCLPGNTTLTVSLVAPGPRKFCSLRMTRITGHRRIHTLEAPYVCRGCRRSYRRSDARKRHWDQEPACSVLHVRNSSDRPSY